MGWVARPTARSAEASLNFGRMGRVSFDVFLSYARTDGARVDVLRDALCAAGLTVWLDNRDVGTFASISRAIDDGLARSKALVAFYSAAYPLRRACQWELTAAFLAAQRIGGDPRRRLFVVNPENSPDHIHPVELRDALFARAPDIHDRAAHVFLAGLIAGHVETLDGQLGSPRTTTPPPWFGRRPIGAARFVGRIADMWALHSALTAREVGIISGSCGEDPSVRLQGMGGIGKSLLAQEYGLRFGAAYPGGVFWLRGHGHDERGDTLSPEARDTERNTQLSAFASELGINCAAPSPGELLPAIAQVLDERASPFLWIADDVPSDLGAAALETWHAPGRYGRTLITTRSRGYRSVGQGIDLGVLSASDGLALLTSQRLPDGPSEERAAIGLVADLGGHPLAIDVAGAGLAAERGTRTFVDYRNALADPSTDELELAAELTDQLPDGHEASIAMTLVRSVVQLGEDALNFLRLASRLGPDPIPAVLVVAAFMIVDDLEESAARARAVKAMHELEVRSLADATDADGMRQVHALVSRTVRLFEADSLRTSALANAAIEVLSGFLHRAVADQIPAEGVAITHARRLGASGRNEREVQLLSHLAAHDTLRGDYGSARGYAEQVLVATRNAFGAEHPQTIDATGQLAVVLRRQGDYDGALAMLEGVVAASERASGSRHPHTLVWMDALANALFSKDDAAAASAMHAKVWAVRRRVLGHDHPETLKSMSNAAAAQWAMGDYASARALQEQCLNSRRRVLGENHPETLVSMGILALALYGQGDYSAARPMQEELSTTFRALLGDRHPHTLMSMNNLGATLLAQGDHGAARALFEEVVAGRRLLFGDAHPETIEAMRNLANAESRGRRR